MSKIVMQAPQGCSSANIEGHTYDIPKNGKIDVVSPSHVDTLKRHGFTDADDDGEPDFESMDAAELVAYIEERGGEADADMKPKKLIRLAREAYAEQNEDA